LKALLLENSDRRQLAYPNRDRTIRSIKHALIAIDKCGEWRKAFKGRPFRPFLDRQISVWACEALAFGQTGVVGIHPGVGVPNDRH
jgi:hypothetical protein